ncbi:TonB-dependent receptor [Mucilaginibacter gynuensis]|uniref:TonB-dependent receptor n=1 Tax=Mucilaginibacter gynuensis TaxID=1302236 RepID=A0ABP8FXP3_9SPHI
MITGALPAAAQQSIKTGISGVVADDKEALPGATITIVETKQSVMSDAKGAFSLSLRPGEYTLSVTFLGMKPISRKITVEAGKVGKLSLIMSSDARMLGAVVIDATRKATTQRALLEMRRASSNIQDAIGAVEIERTASITTAQALSRVTGVTVKDGKYITVRGLSDRNVVVQLNGSRLAGSDAGRSSVSVDLIPAQLLENIVVEKSITPDKPGDANGAVVEIHTKSIPDKPFLEFSAQTGVNGNIGIQGYANSFADADMGFWGQNVKRHNLTQDYLNLQSDYTARGGSIPRGTFGGMLDQAIRSSNIDQAHYDAALHINKVMEEGFSRTLTTNPAQYPLDRIYGITGGTKIALKGEKVIGLIMGLNYYSRSQSNPAGENNLFTTKVPTSSGVGEPNIVYPNELRLVPLYQLSENTGQRQLNYGGLTTVAFRFNKFNAISATYNGNFGTESNATLQDGTANSSLVANDPNVVPTFPPHQRLFDNVLRLTERSLHAVQLKGDHQFRLSKNWKPWQLNYNGSISTARQNDPDFRETRMRLDSNGYIVKDNQLVKSEYKYTYYAESNRYYRLLNEKNRNGKIDLTVPFSIMKDEESLLKFGTYYYHRNRSYNELNTRRQDLSPARYQNEYYGSDQYYGNLTTLGGDLDAWSGPQFVGVQEGLNVVEGKPLVTGVLYVPEAGINTIGGKSFINSYRAKQTIVAFYAMGDLHLSKAWRVVGGLRIENTDYRATPDTLNTDFAGRTGIKTNEEFTRLYKTNYLTYNWLPSGSIIYKGIKDINFRLAFSRTLIRPEINEIVLSAQRDPIQQITVYGNKDLQNGVFNNYDFRTDWFIGQDQLIAGSLFYKTVTGQIERVYIPASANGSFIDQFGFQNTFVTFRNNPSVGKVYGLEFEIRRNLGGLFNFGKYIGINASLMLAKSEATIDSVGYRAIALLDRTADKKRPLVDQPNYAYNINIDVGYPKWGSQINLLYARTGKRLSDINADGSPNIYEYPPASFDVVYSQKITSRLQLKMFGKNLLNSATEFAYGNAGNSHTFGVDNATYIRRRFAYGAVYTIGFKYSL